MDQDENDQGRHAGPNDWFTLPGRLLFVFTILAFTGGFLVYALAIVDDLPPGRYPVFVFVFPVLLAGSLFFLITAWLF